MWLFTKTGFYSVVRKPGDKRLTIRARARGDLIRLKKDYLPRLTKIVELEESDYRWRAHASPTELAHAMSKIAHEIDYSNFKDEVKRGLGPKRAAIYHRVWSVLLELQPLRPINTRLQSMMRSLDDLNAGYLSVDDLRSQRLQADR